MRVFSWVRYQQDLATTLFLPLRNFLHTKVGGTQHRGWIWIANRSCKKQHFLLDATASVSFS